MCVCSLTTRRVLNPKPLGNVVKKSSGINTNRAVSSFLSGRAQCLGTFSPLCVCAYVNQWVCVCVQPPPVWMATERNWVSRHNKLPFTGEREREKKGHTLTGPQHLLSLFFFFFGNFSVWAVLSQPKPWAYLGRTSSSLLQSARSSSPAGKNFEIRMPLSIRSVPLQRKRASAKCGHPRWVREAVNNLKKEIEKRRGCWPVWPLRRLCRWSWGFKGTDQHGGYTAALGLCAATAAYLAHFGDYFHRVFCFVGG